MTFKPGDRVRNLISPSYVGVVDDCTVAEGFTPVIFPGHGSRGFPLPTAQLAHDDADVEMC